MRRRAVTIRSILTSQSGTAAIEFALVGLVFIFLIVGIIEFGRALHTRNEIARAVDAGARALYLHPDYGDAAVEAAVRAALLSEKPDLLITRQPVETLDGVAYSTIVAEFPLELLMLNHLASPITLRITRRVPILPQTSFAEWISQQC